MFRLPKAATVALCVALLLFTPGYSPGQHQLEITAKALALAYAENPARANPLYQGKILRVSGIVMDIGKDIMGQPFVALAGFDIIHSIYCGFPAGMNLKGLLPGDMVRIIGKCAGASLTDVVLTDCGFGD